MRHSFGAQVIFKWAYDYFLIIFRLFIIFGWKGLLFDFTFINCKDLGYQTVYKVMYSFIQFLSATCEFSTNIRLFNVFLSVSKQFNKKILKNTLQGKIKPSALTDCLRELACNLISDFIPKKNYCLSTCSLLGQKLSSSKYHTFGRKLCWF